MADEGTGPQTGTDGGTDYKALYEQAQRDLEASNKEAEKWKAQSRRQEQRAKGNAQAAQDLEGANQQIADLNERIAALESDNGRMQESVARAARAELVAKVASATGVPGPVVASLAANDEQGLTDAARAIAETYKAPGGAPAANEAGAHVSLGQQTQDKAKAFGDAIASALGR